MSSSSSTINWGDVIKKEARGRNDEDLGEVQEVGENYVLVQRGMINKDKFYIPRNLVESYDGDVLRFSITEEDAKSRSLGDYPPSSTSADNGNLTIQIPRDVVDNKKEGNADAPFRVHVDGKDATFKENDNTKTTRTLSIQFGKDAKVIDIIGSTSTVQW